MQATQFPETGRRRRSRELGKATAGFWRSKVGEMMARGGARLEAGSEAHTAETFDWTLLLLLLGILSIVLCAQLNCWIELR